jgi:hypothetical protein
MQFVFLKFIFYEMNSKMVKPRILKLTVREKTDVNDTDVFVNMML